MKPSPPDPEQTLLASDFTVARYKAMRDAADQTAIADAIKRRFTERYIRPPSAKDTSGFTIMAISCLMIEALESFHQGWDSSNGRSQSAFCFFFDREDLFRDFRGRGQQFYKNVRCGILHQAETTAGWRILKVGALLEAGPPPTINAVEFRDRLEKVLNAYCAALCAAEWTGQQWKQTREKMNTICDNCRP